MLGRQGLFSGYTCVPPRNRTENVGHEGADLDREVFTPSRLLLLACVFSSYFHVFRNVHVYGVRNPFFKDYGKINRLTLTKLFFFRKV